MLSAYDKINPHSSAQTGRIVSDDEAQDDRTPLIDPPIKIMRVRTADASPHSSIELANPIPVVSELASQSMLLHDVPLCFKSPARKMPCPTSLEKF